MDRTNISKPEVPMVIKQLFKGLQLDYPLFCKGLDEKHTQATMRRWAKQLFPYTDPTVMKALNRCPDVFNKGKPPTIGEFKSLCKKHVVDYQSRKPLNLEMLKSSSVIGNEALGGIRSLLGMVSESEPAEMDEEAVAARKKELLDQSAQWQEERDSNQCKNESP